MKKKLKQVAEGVAIETNVDEVTNSTNPDIKILYPALIVPLELNVDLGRQDLNDVVGKLQEKINELVTKVNT